MNSLGDTRMADQTTPEDAEVERLLAMTDEEIIAEIEAEGRDPNVVAEEVRGIFERAIAKWKREHA